MAMSGASPGYADRKAKPAMDRQTSRPTVSWSELTDTEDGRQIPVPQAAIACSRNAAR